MRWHVLPRWTYTGLVGCLAQTTSFHYLPVCPSPLAGLLPQTTPTSAPPQPCYALHVLRDCSSLLHGLRQLGASAVKQACLCRAMVLGTAVGWPRRRGYPFLTGVAYSVAWGDLEPSDNNFDFTGMDASLSQTVGYGWRWCLIVSVAPNAPDCLYANNVPKVAPTANSKTQVPILPQRRVQNASLPHDRRCL